MEKLSDRNEGVDWPNLFSESKVIDDWAFDRLEGEALTSLSVIFRSKQKKAFERKVDRPYYKVILNKPDHKEVEVAETKELWEGWINKGQEFSHKEGKALWRHFWNNEDSYVEFHLVTKVLDKRRGLFKGEYSTKPFEEKIDTKPRIEEYQDYEYVSLPKLFIDSVYASSGEPKILDWENVIGKKTLFDQFKHLEGQTVEVERSFLRWLRLSKEWKKPYSLELGIRGVSFPDSDENCKPIAIRKFERKIEELNSTISKQKTRIGELETKNKELEESLENAEEEKENLAETSQELEQEKALLDATKEKFAKVRDLNNRISNMTDRQRSVFNALIENGILSPSEIAEKTGQQPPNVNEPLKDLTEKGLIYRYELSKKQIFYSIYLPDLLSSILDLGFEEEAEEYLEEEDREEDEET